MRVIAVPRFRAPERHRLGAQAFPQGIPRLPGTRHYLALALALAPLLGSCANNPIARQLAASFDTPAPTPAPSPGAGSPQAAGGTAPQANSAAQGQAGANPAVGISGASPLVPPSGIVSSPGTGAKPDQKASGATGGAAAAGGAAGPGAKPGAKGNAQGAAAGSASAQAPAKPRAATPTPAAAPYRVTLKLPGADPSAPAEVVTRALRAAGVPFEVETIERIGAGNDGSSSRPAALRSMPAPAVR